MKREIIKIDEDKCNGCGLCIPNCHEGALQIIDGKARLISDLMCDGLGACIGHCPEGAMEIEVREAVPYDEIQVMEEMVKKGRNTVTAHMKHLKDHGEFVFLKQAVGFLTENAGSVNFPVREVIQQVHSYHPNEEENHLHETNGKPSKAVATMSGGGCGGALTDATIADNASGNRVHDGNLLKGGHSQGGGCPGSRSMSFGAALNNESLASIDANPAVSGPATSTAIRSQLSQWPVQMHLINPQAAHFRGSDLLLAADCVAYSVGNFHNGYLKGKTLAIACPKLDSNKEVYIEKLVRLINEACINTLTVMKMEVPCCGGIVQIAVKAAETASRKVPVKSITVGVQGNILGEEWL